MSNRINELGKTLISRGDRYGHFSDIAALSTDLRTTWHIAFQARDEMELDVYKNWGLISEAATMILHKLSRIAIGDPTYRDNWMDIAGYAMRLVMEMDRLEGVKKKDIIVNDPDLEEGDDL